MKEKLIEIILNIIEENGIELNVNTIEETTLLIDDLGFDSFNLAQLTVEIESQFGVDIFENGVVSNLSDILNQLK